MITTYPTGTPRLAIYQSQEDFETALDVLKDLYWQEPEYKEG
jgi:hypothetical protein